MPQLSNADLELSRTHTQYTELYLTLFRPATILDGTVEDVAVGTQSIPYVGVTGSYLNVENDMTMLIGTSSGGDELGKIRVRSASATRIEVAENSNINWPAATSIRILKYWEVWPVYPRIIIDPNNDTDVIFYKDYDEVYTNQNSVLGVFPCAGTHRAAFAGNSLYYTSAGTTHLVTGTTLSYAWTFEGGSPTGTTSAVPGYVNYPTAGDYVTKLIVTGNNGSSDTTYRYVCIRNKIGTSDSLIPIRKWEMDSLTGSRDEGGYSTSIRIIDEIVPTLRDGDVVFIWSDDYYGSTHTSLGGNSTNNSSIFFIGHVVNGSIRYNYKTSTTEFDVASITDTMKNAEGFAISVEDTGTPTKWYQMLEMDGRRAIYHYLKWQSTVLNIADFEFVGQDRHIQFFDSDRESLFDSVDNYMRDTLVGSIVADRQNKMWAEINAEATPNPTGTFLPIQDITKRDWIGEPSIEVRNVAPISYLEAGGVAYWGIPAGGTFSALISAAPGLVPSTRGTPERLQGLALDSQFQLNELTGNMYANRVTRYPKIAIDGAGNYQQFEIAPQEAVQMKIAQADTNSGITIDAPYIIDSITWNYEPRDKTLLPSIDFKSLVAGYPGETILIPDVPPEVGYDLPTNFDLGGGFSFPPIPIFTENPLNGQSTTVVLASNKGVLYTFNFDSSVPEWAFMNDGLGGNDVNSIGNIVVTPDRHLYLMTNYTGTVVGGAPSGYQKVYTAPGVGQPWSLLWDAATDYPEANSGVWGLGVNPDVPNTIAIWGGRIWSFPYDSNFGLSYLGIGDHTGISLAGSHANPKPTKSSVLFSNNNWIVFTDQGTGQLGSVSSPFRLKFTSGGTVIDGILIPGIGGNTPMYARSAGTSDLIYYWEEGTGVLYKATTNATLFTAQTIQPAPNREAIAPAPPSVSGDAPGQKLMGAINGGGLFPAYQSTDGGSTWSQAINIPVGGDIWENCKDQTRWIFGGGVTLRFTMDRGTVYVYKSGNIIYLNPFIDITHIRFVS